MIIIIINIIIERDYSKKIFHLFFDFLLPLNKLTHMLKIQQYKHKTHSFRTFSCFGPHIWNHSHKTLDTVQPGHPLKPNWKPSTSHSIFTPTNIINTQYPVSATVIVSVYVYMCVCVCVCVRTHMCACMCTHLHIQSSVIDVWVQCSLGVFVFPYIITLCQLFWYECALHIYI